MNVKLTIFTAILTVSLFLQAQASIRSWIFRFQNIISCTNKRWKYSFCNIWGVCKRHNKYASTRSDSKIIRWSKKCPTEQSHFKGHMYHYCHTINCIWSCKHQDQSHRQIHAKQHDYSSWKESNQNKIRNLKD